MSRLDDALGVIVGTVLPGSVDWSAPRNGAEKEGK